MAMRKPDEQQRVMTFIAGWNNLADFHDVGT